MKQMTHLSRLRWLGIVALSLLLSHLGVRRASAQAPVDTAHVSAAAVTFEPIVGYLSYDSLLHAMPDYTVAMARQESLREAYEAELKRVTDEFNSKYEDFLEGQAEFPRTILLKRQTELQELMRQNQLFRQQGLDDLKTAEEEALRPLRQRLASVIAEVAASHRLAIVVNTDLNATLYIDPKLCCDLTDEALAKLKE